MITVRAEREADHDAVRSVNDRAFGTPEEGKIVEKLRQACEDTVSLVAVSDDTIVGHIFFSPVTIDNEEQRVTGMGLAPILKTL